MSGENLTVTTRALQWFPPNPVKHGVLIGRTATGKKKAVTRDQHPVTLELLKAHLLGQGQHLGYLPGWQEGTSVGVIDLDGQAFENLDQALASLMDAIRKSGLIATWERSLSGHGYHVWVWADATLLYTVMRDALHQLVTLAALPKNTEVYPMGADATGRWVFMPYYGALTDSQGLGRTFLTGEDGKPISITELDERLRLNPRQIFDDLATTWTQQHHVPPAPPCESTLDHPNLKLLDPAMVPALLLLARQQAPSQRHDALMAFVNLGRRAGGLAEMAHGLKQPEIFKLWCADGSRTPQEWTSEIDRLASVADGEPGRPTRGLPYLRELGFDLSAVPGAGEGNDTAGVNSERKVPAGTRALQYVLGQGAEAWKDEEGTAFLTVKVQGRWEHLRMSSRGARDYIFNVFYDRESRGLSTQALGEALATLEARARREGQIHPTGLRVKSWQGWGYLDLGRDDWKVVEVGAGGWRLIDAEKCPVRFTRSPQMRALPIPALEGSFQPLAGLLNTDRRGLILCTAFLLGAVSARGPYPHLAFKGEQGVGKSTAASTLQRLVDPTTASRRRAPRKEQDLFIAARSAHILSFDNLSTITGDLSDSLCCLSTGGSFATRTLHTNDEETVLQAMRPAIINGIPDLMTRPDLAERTLLIELRRIGPGQRLTEEELEARFVAAHPRLLGALLTALAVGLDRLSETRLEHPPRLADFARLVVAAEPALPWTPGEFLQVYTAMQDEAAQVVLEGDEVAEALREFMDERGCWEGQVKRLLSLLNEQQGFTPGLRPFPRDWPKNARALGERLRRVAPALSKIGYETTFVGRKKDGMYYRLNKSSETTYTTDTHET